MEIFPTRQSALSGTTERVLNQRSGFERPRQHFTYNMNETRAQNKENGKRKEKEKKIANRLGKSEQWIEETWENWGGRKNGEKLKNWKKNWNDNTIKDSKIECSFGERLLKFLYTRVTGCKQKNQIYLAQHFLNHLTRFGKKLRAISGNNANHRVAPSNLGISINDEGGTWSHVFFFTCHFC